MTTAQANTEAKAKRDTASATFSGDFRTAVEDAAKAQNKSLSNFVREMVAREIGFTGEMRARGKYASDEERKAAAQAAATKRREEVKQALAFWKEAQAKAAAANSNGNGASATADAPQTAAKR